MADPIRLEVPADPSWLRVVDVVVGAAARFAHDEVGALDELAIAVREAATEAGATAGVDRLEVTIDGDRVDVVGRGVDVAWEPGPVWERLVPSLASVGWEADPSTVRIELAPKPA